MANTDTQKPSAFFQFMMKMLNPSMKRLLRSRLHGIVSNQYMLITVRGRKSGKYYTTPVQYKQDGDMIYVLSSAGYLWWKNLRGGAPVTLVVRGKEFKGQADVSQETEDITHHLLTIYPKFDLENHPEMLDGKAAITVKTQPA